MLNWLHVIQRIWHRFGSSFPQVKPFLTVSHPTFTTVDGLIQIENSQQTCFHKNEIVVQFGSLPTLERKKFSVWSFNYSPYVSITWIIPFWNHLLPSCCLYEPVEMIFNNWGDWKRWLNGNISVKYSSDYKIFSDTALERELKIAVCDEKIQSEFR